MISLENIDDARHQLCDLLQQALMLELSTIPPYATACYSILEQGQYDRSEPVIVNAEPIEVIRQVMVEEMLHMVLVANVMNAMGFAPQLNNPDLLPRYPMDLLGGDGPHVRLRRFCPDQIKSFRQIEAAPESLGGAREGHYHTIGGFYTYLRDQMNNACKAFGAEAIFVGAPERQISNDDYFGAGGQVIEIKGSAEDCLKAALKAIQEIMEEGEGAELGGVAGDKHIIPGPGEQEDIAHFFKFNEILHSRYYCPADKASDPPTGADLTVDWGAVAPMRDDLTEDDYADAPEIAAISQEFNAAWSRLLDGLDRAFNVDKAALTRMLPAMYDIKYLAQKLMQIPLPDGSGQTAGPTWTYIAPK